MHAASAFDCALRHRAGLETAGVAAGVLVALAVARCRRREGLTHDAYTHMLREGLHNALGSRLLAGGTVREGAGRRVALRVDVYIELVLRLELGRRVVRLDGELLAASQRRPKPEGEGVAAAGSGDEVEARVELGEPRGEEGGVGPLALNAAHACDDVRLGASRTVTGVSPGRRGDGERASVMNDPSMVVPGHQGGL